MNSKIYKHFFMLVGNIMKMASSIDISCFCARLTPCSSFYFVFFYSIDLNSWIKQFSGIACKKANTFNGLWSFILFFYSTALVTANTNFMGISIYQFHFSNLNARMWIVWIRCPVINNNCTEETQTIEINII